MLSVLRAKAKAPGPMCSTKVTGKPAALYSGANAGARIAGLSTEVEDGMAKSNAETGGQGLRAQWQARLERFARDGGSVAAFCAAEGVSAWSLYRWRRKLGAEAGKVPARTAVAKSVVRAVDTAGFIDVGVARVGGAGEHAQSVPPAAAAPVQVRIELGGGLLVRILRAC
ncbi:MAG: IS66 family insertion sequence element accessory protein TnpA [Pseudomonadota bacterium]